MATGEGSPLSLRPFPVADQKPKNIAEFIARVNAQPGGFRALSSANLQDQIAAQKDVTESTEPEDVDMSEGEEEEEDGAEKDPNQVRLEVLRNLDIATAAAGWALDSISLLMSKQNPTQAGLTLSKDLRELVGIGTLGASKLYDSNLTPAREKEQETVALGWTLMEVNKTKESAEAACTFLEKEVEAEGTYWEDVIGVQKSGWAVCKMPQEKHTLGVRFGFAESAPEFKNNGLAPLRRGNGGVVQLDCGRLGGVSERLLIIYEKDGQVVSRSALPAQTEETAPLEARVLEARNTLYAQELWHELGREARTLASYDVRRQGSRLVWDIDSSSKVTAELVALGSEASSNDPASKGEIAETISVTLHLLLGQAHRHSQWLRTRPMPPHIPRPKGNQTYPLLRPIIARLSHISNVRSCTRLVGDLVQTITNTGLESSFTLQTSQFAISEPAGSDRQSRSQQVIQSLLNNVEFSLELSIIPGISLTIRGRSILAPYTATEYRVILPEDSLLEAICAPYKEYPSVEALADYIRIATARLLTHHFLNKHQTPRSDSDGQSRWTQSMEGNSIQPYDSELPSLEFILTSTNALRLTQLADVKGGDRSWTWSSKKDMSESSTLDDVVSQALS